MPRVCLVHLVWAPYGPELLERFLASLQRHDPGTGHELLMVFNGFGAGGPTAAFTGLLGEVEHTALVLDPPVQDLPAYRAACDATDAEVICCTNSYAEARVDGWLGLLTAAAARADVGLAGATGSWESAFSSAPAVLRVQRFARFPRFPNPNLRTNAFAGRRALLRELDWSGTDAKLGALVLESGRRSLSAQVRRRGLRTVVVGRDGTLHDPIGWKASGTFRTGEQENLLVSDNRTRDYLAAGPDERALLARMAWGRGAIKRGGRRAPRSSRAA